MLINNGRILKNGNNIFKSQIVQSFISFDSSSYSYVYLGISGVTINNPLHMHYETPTGILKFDYSSDVSNYQQYIPATFEGSYKEFYFSGDLNALYSINFYNPNYYSNFYYIGDLIKFMEQFPNLTTAMFNNQDYYYYNQSLFNQDISNSVFPNKIKVFNLHDASVSGKISTIANFEKIENLKLINCGFSENITNLNFVNLRFLYLSYLNYLDGNINDAVDNNPNLQLLRVDTCNLFSGNATTLDVSKLKDIYFNVYGAPNFTGLITNWTFNTGLTSFNLYNQYLDGNITNWDFSNTLCSTIYMYNSSTQLPNIQGSLSGWTLPNTLTSFNIWYITGLTSMPTDFSNTSLYTCYMYYIPQVSQNFNNFNFGSNIQNIFIYLSQITGNIETYVMPPRLYALGVQSSKLTGNFSAITFNNVISQLYLDDNLLTGNITGTVIPSTLQFLDLSRNTGLTVNFKSTPYVDAVLNRMARLNSNGNTDSSFATGSGFSDYVYSIAVQSDGKILAGGWFTTFDGNTVNYITRLNSNGSLDTGFATGGGFDSVVNSIVVQSDGKILIGGDFNTYSGNTANKIIRLNSNGSIDTSFLIDTGFDFYVSSIAVQSDGKILVGGSFTTYDGNYPSHIVRLNSGGSIDTGFVTGNGFNSDVSSIVVQSNGKILVGGYFTIYDNATIKYITRLNSGGSVDTGFVKSGDFDNSVNSIAIQSGDSKILVGGSFMINNGETTGVFHTKNLYYLYLGNISGITGNLSNLVFDTNIDYLAIYGTNTNCDLSKLNSKKIRQLSAYGCPNIYGDLTNWLTGTTLFTFFDIRYNPLLSGNTTGWNVNGIDYLHLNATNLTGVLKHNNIYYMDADSIHISSNIETDLNFSNRAVSVRLSYCDSIVGNLSGVTLNMGIYEFRINGSPNIYGSNAFIDYIFINKKNFNYGYTQFNIQNIGDTVTGATETLGSLGTWTGDPNDLNEGQANNLALGIDYTGSGTNTPWDSKNKIYWVLNARVSSVNLNKRYTVYGITY